MARIIDPIKISLADFRRIPGVGKSIAQDFIDMGFTSTTQLREQDPEKLYTDFMKLRGCYVDRCMLYVFRCAVYFATEETHEQEKLNWWYWKDKPYTP